MRILHLIFGLRNSFLLCAILLSTCYSFGQVKTYVKINVDSLKVNNLRLSNDAKIEDVFLKVADGVPFTEVFNDLIIQCLVIKDSQVLDILNLEENWRDNIFISQLPQNLKVGQYAIEKTDHYLFLYEGNKLIRIPIIFNKISNLNLLQLAPLDNPPNEFQKGTIYFDNNIKRLKYFNGSKWKKM